MPIDVDFGKDVIIPAGTEFAIVREKSINSQTNPTYSVLCTNSKTGFVKGNISFFQNGSWLWSYNRNAFVNVGFVYKMEKYNQLK
ncbi:MAG: hypothetical protein LBU27_02935 [Candidatus Peribacteria bacterium]|jgi:hypothetical protein|nr:hypothetical protein [Candidatus Peribacteria bacterium]